MDANETKPQKRRRPMGLIMTTQDVHDLSTTHRCRDCGSQFARNPRFPTDPAYSECGDCGSTHLHLVPVPDDEGLAVIAAIEDAVERAAPGDVRAALLSEVYADAALAARIRRRLDRSPRPDQLRALRDRWEKDIIALYELAEEEPHHEGRQRLHIRAAEVERCSAELKAAVRGDGPGGE